jgi:hypothetical protein
MKDTKLKSIENQTKTSQSTPFKSEDKANQAYENSC